MIEIDKLDAFKFANDLAIKWFDIHADHRLRMINFFLIVAGFCVAGFFAALQAKNQYAASVISFVLVCVSCCFKQLDRRISQLVKLSEDFLRESLSEIGRTLSADKANIVMRAEDKDGVLSLRQTFNVLYWLFGILGVAGIIAPWTSVVTRYDFAN